MENWRDVRGYEGLYQVSDFGRVRSVPHTVFKGRYGKMYVTEKILHQTQTRGYVYVSLCGHGNQKRVRVHRLVAEAFIPNPNNLPQVNHKDENPSNNKAENLEWCTSKYNTNYGTGRERASAKIRGRHVSEETKQKLSERIVSEETRKRISESNKLARSKQSEKFKRQLSEKFRKIMFDRYANGYVAPSKDRIYVNNGEHNKQIKPEDLQKYLDNGYVRGMKPRKKKI